MTGGEGKNPPPGDRTESLQYGDPANSINHDKGKIKYATIFQQVVAPHVEYFILGSPTLFINYIFSLILMETALMFSIFLLFSN